MTTGAAHVQEINPVKSRTMHAATTPTRTPPLPHRSFKVYSPKEYPTQRAEPIVLLYPGFRRDIHGSHCKTQKECQPITSYISNTSLRSGPAKMKDHSNNLRSKIHLWKRIARIALVIRVTNKARSLDIP